MIAKKQNRYRTHRGKEGRKEERGKGGRKEGTNNSLREDRNEANKTKEECREREVGQRE